VPELPQLTRVRSFWKAKSLPYSTDPPSLAEPKHYINQVILY